MNQIGIISGKKVISNLCMVNYELITEYNEVYKTYYSLLNNYPYMKWTPKIIKLDDPKMVKFYKKIIIEKLIKLAKSKIYIMMNDIVISNYK